MQVFVCAIGAFRQPIFMAYCPHRRRSTINPINPPRDFRRRTPAQSGPRINHQIRVPQVRLIGSAGQQLGLFSLEGALKLADEEGLDLVEVSPQAEPPVCKLVDYGKYKYQLSKKQQQSKKHQIVVHLKEVKFRPTTDEHDLQFKVKHIRRFIEDKDKVKVTVVFKGREMAHTDRGLVLLERIMKETADVAAVDKGSQMEGRTMALILSPK